MNSNIFLQVVLHLEMPQKLFKSNGMQDISYNLDYKVSYSVFEKKWTETEVEELNHKSEPVNFQYHWHASYQEVSKHIFNGDHTQFCL